MDWDEIYRKGEVFWNKGAPSPPLSQYLERHKVRGRALAPGCGHGVTGKPNVIPLSGYAN